MLVDSCANHEPLSGYAEYAEQSAARGLEREGMQISVRWPGGS